MADPMTRLSGAVASEALNLTRALARALVLSGNSTDGPGLTRHFRCQTGHVESSFRGST